MPKVPFHPKAFLFQGKDNNFALAGSGNLSGSGLSKGVEVGLTLAVDRKNPLDLSSAASMKGLRRWFNQVWDDGDALECGLAHTVRHFV